MSQGKEQDQLLADASTLLMFASAAARQQSPPNLSASEAGSIRDTSALQRPSNAPDSTARRTSIADVTSPIVSAGHQPQVPHIRGMLRPPGVPSMYANTTYTGVPSTNLPPPQISNKTILPSLQPFQMGRGATGSIDARLSAPGGYPYAAQGASNARPGAPLLPPASTLSNPHTSAANAAPMMPHSSYGFYGLDNVSAGNPGPVPRMYTGGYTASNIGSGNIPLRRQSSAQTSGNLEEPILQSKLRKTQSASPQDSAAGHDTPPKLLPLSPRPPDVLRPAQIPNTTVQPHELPARGHFQTTHRRTSSGTASKRPPVTSPTLSPGLANGSLSRGINVESGKRSTDNAMIAAAALAVAADMPFPLKPKDEKGEARRPDLNVDTSSKNSESQSRLTAAAPASNDLENSVKAEDSVVTETEDDDNKTEDEPVSSAVRESFNLAELPTVMNHSKPPEATTQPAETVKVKGDPVVKHSIDEPVNPEVSASAITEKSVSPSSPMMPPPLSTYKVDPDAGLIGCICGIEEDDGFTIQCDICFRWQHCSCMGYLTSEEVPEDEYKCYYCDEQKWNKMDPESCRAATITRLDMDKYNEVPKKPAPPKRKSSHSGNEDKKRRKSEKEVKAPTDKPTLEKRKSSSAASPTSKPVASFDFHNKENDQLEDGATAELYQGVYYRLEENDYKTPEVKSMLAGVGARYEKSSKGVMYETMSQSQFRSLKFSKINLPNHQKYLQERNELRRGKGFNKTTIKVKTYSENPKQKFVSVVKTGLFITENSVSTVGEATIPVGTVVIEYLGEVDFWQSHVDNIVNQYPLWGTVKPKVTTVKVPCTETEAVDLVIDSRFVGNESRFIRRSCASTANCELRPVFIPQLQTFKFLVVTTQPIILKNEKHDEELRLPWGWDSLHPINHMIKSNSAGVWEEGKKFEDFSEEDKAYLITCVDTILNFVECGCNTSTINNQCAIFKVKKATSYLLRSNRKAASLGGAGLHKSKEELVLPKQSKDYISWKQRLIARDQMLLESSPLAKGQIVFESTHKSAAGSVTPEAIPAISSGAESGDGIEEKKQYRSTFKQAVLAQARKLSITSYRISPTHSDIFDESTIAGEVTSEMLAVPFTSKVLAKIKRQVSEVLKPLQKDLPSVDVVADAKEVKNESQPESLMIADDRLPPVIVKSLSNEPAIPEKKPVVVKKFSFADYKKKMK